METNTQRGRVTVSLGGQTRSLRFGLAFMLAYTEAHKVDVGELHQRLTTDPFRSLIDMAVVAIRKDDPQALPADPAAAADTVADWLDEAPQEVADQLVAAILNGLEANPLMAAMSNRQKATAPAPLA